MTRFFTILLLVACTQAAIAQEEEPHISSGMKTASDSWWPGGFHYGFSYIATIDNVAILDIDLLGVISGFDSNLYGNFLDKRWVGIGGSPIRFELNFKTDQIISDEFIFFVAPVGLLSAIAGAIHENAAIPFVVLLEIITGNNYWSLTDSGRFGLFDYHHVVSWFWSDEWGYVENVGLRYVYKKNERRSTSYIDLGASLRYTNKDWAVGLFVRWGGTQMGK